MDITTAQTIEDAEHNAARRERHLLQAAVCNKEQAGVPQRIAESEIARWESIEPSFRANSGYAPPTNAAFCPQCGTRLAK
jgi:hypothetical protein